MHENHGIKLRCRTEVEKCQVLLILLPADLNSNGVNVFWTEPKFAVKVYKVNKLFNVLFNC